MNAKSPLPIGIEIYKELIHNNYYYIDKTLLIRDLIDDRGKVNLFTRPRRFGKTLALSMIQAFFEQEIDSSGNIIDNSSYFKDRKILLSGEKYTHFIGRYPVITLSLKSAKQKDFSTAYDCLVQQISKEYERHNYILNSEVILDSQKDIFRSIIDPPLYNFLNKKYRTGTF